MYKSQIRNRHKILSLWIVVCGLLYIFAYQFKLPFRADTFLYGLVVGLALMTLYHGKVALSKHVALFALVALSSFIGLIYTTMPAEGRREAILFAFFMVVFWLSLTNPALVITFSKWIFIFSVIIVLSSIVHYLAPLWFNVLMKQILREDAYRQLMWSYSVDSAFAGLSAYTPNTTFSAAIVFGNAFLHILNKHDSPIIKSKLINGILLVLSVFSIIICSKRGIFVATFVALFVLMFYLYRRKNFLVKFLGVAVFASIVLLILYNTNESVFVFLNRFVGDNITTGRDAIYEALMSNFDVIDLMIGHGTAATYELAQKGAHNIYFQILYDHGILFSIPYFALFLYNIYLAFRNKCPLSIFVQTMFLVYGLSGNPLYSNMFMMIYIYHVLLATRIPQSREDKYKHLLSKLRFNASTELNQERSQ